MGFDESGALGDGGTTPLMMAAHKGDVDEVKGYVKNGAKLDAQDLYGWTALRYAVRADQVAAAKELIAGGADLNLPSQSGPGTEFLVFISFHFRRTPLMSAASNGIADMV